MFQLEEDLRFPLYRPQPRKGDKEKLRPALPLHSPHDGTNRAIRRSKVLRLKVA